MLTRLDQWVDYIQGLHAREIELSLDRVGEVFQRLRPQGVDFKVITVAGTNGKGSTCELLASIYDAAGYATGKYSSPHIEMFNERYSINRKNVFDDDLLPIFERIEQARGSVGLTFFEFGTLIAIELFADHNVDVAIMEVGLGGRLDAVNILDADLAIITSISIDHTDWLGSSIDEIAGEKIAITRPYKPCVIGMSDPPELVINYCLENNVPVSQSGVDFQFDHLFCDLWSWSNQDQTYDELPLPFKQAGVQLQNAAAALAGIAQLHQDLSVQKDKIIVGIEKATLMARCQLVSKRPTVIVDVAHNQASVQRLADFITSLAIEGKVYSLCGMLKDKQIEQSLACLADIVDEWNFVSIDHVRGSSAQELAERFERWFGSLKHSSFKHSTSSQPGKMQLNCHDNVENAYRQVIKKLNNDDALIVFGSFFVVSDIMPLVSLDNDSFIGLNR
ncbi:MAG: bifunctional tetrahydrofolate synthase/dihydrofolate synthase [Acidiferrobacterales bacterium]|nr:bifunctional tetrahydrofolate synthase/dihydrofolate synthase [Acidiferrobacterales bacterium]